MNNEGKNTIQVLDARTMKRDGVVADRALRRSHRHRLRPGVEPHLRRLLRRRRWSSTRPRARWWRRSRTATASTPSGGTPAEQLIYIPAGRDGNVTVVHQDAPDKYRVVATVPTMRGAKTIAVDPVTHVAYLFQPEYGPPPAPAPGAPAPRPARAARAVR